LSVYKWIRGRTRLLPVKLPLIQVGGKYRTCWITWLASYLALRMVLLTGKKELSHSYGLEKVFPDIPSSVSMSCPCSFLEDWC